MKNEVYHLVTVKNVKSDTAEILGVLADMKAGRLKYDLSLINYYDEVPIVYGSTINLVDQDSVEMAVHEHQAIIIKNNNSTLLRCKYFNKGLDVHCYAAYVNVPKKLVILHNFSYAQIRAARREAVRVKVHEVLPVTFNYEEGGIDGTIVDISGNGISIQCDYLIPELEKDQPGELSFTLSGTKLDVPGSFVASSTDNSGITTCVFKLKPGRLSDRIIGQFIYLRQVEIIQQLKDGLLLDA